jgi:hypothetical protein
MLAKFLNVWPKKTFWQLSKSGTQDHHRDRLGTSIDGKATLGKKGSLKYPAVYQRMPLWYGKCAHSINMLHWHVALPNPLNNLHDFATVCDSEITEMRKSGNFVRWNNCNVSQVLLTSHTISKRAKSIIFSDQASTADELLVSNYYNCQRIW